MNDSMDLPNCPECGSSDVGTFTDEPVELVCSDCGFVFEKESRAGPETDIGWKKEGDFEFSKTVRSDSTKQERWTDQTSPAIVGLIQEPNRTYHEYYRIENPRDFFEGCSNEQDELKRIRESDLEPFETLELPDIEWRYSVH